MKWRDHLPENCPPDDAIPTNGVVYRFAGRKNFDERDFLSYREIYPEKEYDSECIASGISIFTERAGIDRLLKRIPAKRRRRKRVIKGILKPEYGKMKNTPSYTHKSHHTWWLTLETTPWLEFKIIDSEENN